VLCLSRTGQDLPLPLHPQPQVALILLCDHRLEGLGRLGMPQLPLDRSFALHACSALLVRLSMPILGQRTAQITAQTMGATTCTLSPRTPGALEVVPHGLSRSSASLIAHPCPQSARHLSFGTKFPARLSTLASLTPDTTSPGGHRNAAHPDECTFHPW